MIPTDYIIRQVKKEDSKRLWQIRNHSLVRKNSTNSQSIPFEEHRKWFEKKYFSGQNNYCFVLEKSGGEVIGYCRFDFSPNDNAYIVSIALEPEYQGQGLGDFLLNGCLRKFESKRDILAKTKKANIVSVKLFPKNNFQLYKEDLQNYFLKYTPDIINLKS